MAVFAPIPSVSVSTATAVKPGFFSSWRKANLRSFITQRLHWIDFRRLPSCEIAREYCRGGQEPRGERYAQILHPLRVGVRPDAKREREHGHDGEVGVFRQLAGGEFEAG